MPKHCGRSRKVADALRLLLAAWTAASVCGCGDDRYPLGGARSGVGECRDGAALEPIHDMEDGTGSIAALNGRSGVWFSFNDGTGEQIPDRTAEYFAMTALEPPRAGSHFAAHTSGEGFKSWGAGIGFELESQRPYDASSYAGFAFWARGVPGSTTPLRVNARDRNTSPLGGVCDDAQELCHDDFGSDVALDGEFRYYEFRWEELTQVGWSEIAYPGIARDAIYGLRFQTAAGVPFDYWIDDVVFLCEP